MTHKPAAPPKKVADNPFGNFPDWLLADTMGDLDAQADTISARMKLAKAEMERRHRISLQGTRFDIAKSVETERRLDTAGLKREYGTEWYEGWYKENPRTKYTITAKPLVELGGTS